MGLGLKELGSLLNKLSKTEESLEDVINRDDAIAEDMDDDQRRTEIEEEYEQERLEQELEAEEEARCLDDLLDQAYDTDEIHDDEHALYDDDFDLDR